MSERTSDRSEYARSFDGAAALYAAARPDYPPGALTWLLPARTRRVLDLGAGTGKLTAQLVGAGLQVTAVEPSPAMLAQLRCGLPDVEAHAAPAEAIPATDATFDAGRRAELLADVERVLAEHPDLRGLSQLDVPYETLCWRAERR